MPNYPFKQQLALTIINKGPAWGWMLIYAYCVCVLGPVGLILLTPGLYILHGAV